MNSCDPVEMSRLKLPAHLAISHFYWNECEERVFTPVEPKPVLVIDSNDLLPDLLKKIFLFRRFIKSEVII
jgi:hypothetical protein